MSESSRENMETAKEYLDTAGKHLKKAAEYAGSGGDKDAQQRIQKLAEGASKEAGDISKKLGTKEG
jgi:hypothetical protein